jgi:hypothetical protein
VAQATIDKWVAAGDTSAIRGHAWSLWAGMTAKTGQTFNGQELPIWETWDGFRDVFASTVTVSATGGPPPRVRSFQRPLQFHHPVNGVVVVGAADNAHIVADNKFDPVAAKFITAKQAGPGGATYSYASGESLNKLNAAWPAGTTGQARTINDFPERAIELKPVFSLVKASGLTAQPVWRGLAGATNQKNPTSDTWTTCILIDPAGKGALRAATAAEVKQADLSGLACKTFLYGPLDLFYAVRLTAPDAANFQAASGSTAKGGDYAVLLGMHVNTKEIPFWTWQTFWWQPGVDTPGAFPGSKAGQPASVTGPWKNYATCANYDQTTKPGGKVMQVCFNPYLETSPGIPAGIQSNCMSCHGTARIAANSGYPADYKAPIAFFSDPKYFNAGSTHTDFSWAIPSAP